MPNKVDSNLTGLRYAEETSFKTLPGTPDWKPMEPNSYSDFGGEVTTIARNPINDTRQRLKGVITDLDASGGLNSDLTQSNMYDLMQGFMFASWVKRANQAVTAVATADDSYAVASNAGFLAGHLAYAKGFAIAANNGLKNVTTPTSGKVVVTQNLVDEGTPPAGATIKVVGYQATAGDIDVDTTTVVGESALTSTTLDFTTLGWKPGDWIFIGGDTTVTKFGTAANNGFCRVKSVAANRVVMDKTASAWVTEANTTSTLQMFYGDTLNNATTPGDLVRRTYNIERSLSDGGFEYLEGAVPSTWAMNVATADKVNLDVTFIAGDNTQRTVVEGAKTGNRPALVSEDCFNTSSDFSRIDLRVVGAAAPLVSYLQDLTLNIDNNLQPNKAISVLGAFDVSAGTFAVDGNLTAYFSDVEAVRAVRNNSDVTLDFALVKANKGIICDVPLLALGDGRLNVQQDQPILLPLSTPAAKHPTLGYTLSMQSFDYLPNAAG